MKNSKYNEDDYESSVSEKTHPSPDKDSRFYRKSKPELSLSNPTVTYCKQRKRLLSQ